MRVVFVLSFLCLIALSPAVSAAPRSPFLEDLTWTEVRDALQAGTTTVIIPVGGTEQSGPHMALGKHNARVKALAGRIADALGDTLVAPVVAYVPEGAIAPPAGHMRFPGTISIPDSAFKSLLDATGRSLKQAGFTHIVLIGDHGDYQGLLRDVAAQLNREWAKTPVRAYFIEDYYRVTQTAYVQALRAKGLSDAEIGSHAGVADTSLLLAVDPDLVRTDRLGSAQNNAANGVLGDPRASTAALGQIGVDLIVAQTVAAIRKARLRQH